MGVVIIHIKGIGGEGGGAQRGGVRVERVKIFRICRISSLEGIGGRRFRAKRVVGCHAPIHSGRVSRCEGIIGGERRSGGRGVVDERIEVTKGQDGTLTISNECVLTFLALHSVL